MAQAGDGDIAGSLAAADLALRRDQRRLVRWEIVVHRISAATKLLMAIALLAALIGAGLLLRSATQAKGVTITPFSVPPDMEQRGLTGTALAAALLDKLGQMQSQTASMRASSTYANNWGNDIKIEIPRTGISLAELINYLRRWLGKDTIMSGELYRLPDGRVALTTRVGATPGRRFEGAAQDIDTLVGKSAEAIYEATQPYRYGAWLSRQDRVDEARAIFQRLLLSDDANDRLWANVGLSSITESLDDQRLYAARAMAADPRFTIPLNNLALLEISAGHEERAFELLGKVIEIDPTRSEQFDPDRARLTLLVARSLRASLLGDLLQAQAIDRQSQLLDRRSFTQDGNVLGLAQDAALLHDLATMRDELAKGRFSDADLSGPRIEQSSLSSDPRPTAARAIGAWGEARQRLAALSVKAATADHDIAMTVSANDFAPDLAIAQARTGHFADAAATLRATPLDHALAVRARGTVAALAGHPRAADHWFRMAVAMTPSLPAAHADWAEALLMRGDLDGAIAQARLANEKGPHSAEPLETWAHALFRKRDYRASAERYEEAARHAPRWGRLHLRWGLALTKAGDRAGAEAQWHAARTMDLNRVERRVLEQLLADPGAPA